MAAAPLPKPDPTPEQTAHLLASDAPTWTYCAKPLPGYGCQRCGRGFDCGDGCNCPDD